MKLAFLIAGFLSIYSTSIFSQEHLIGKYRYDDAHFNSWQELEIKEDYTFKYVRSGRGCTSGIESRFVVEGFLKKINNQLRLVGEKTYAENLWDRFDVCLPYSDSLLEANPTFKIVESDLGEKKLIQSHFDTLIRRDITGEISFTKNFFIINWLDKHFLVEDVRTLKIPSEKCYTLINFANVYNTKEWKKDGYQLDKISFVKDCESCNYYEKPNFPEAYQDYLLSETLEVKVIDIKEEQIVIDKGQGDGIYEGLRLYFTDKKGGRIIVEKVEADKAYCSRKGEEDIFVNQVFTTLNALN